MTFSTEQKRNLIEWDCREVSLSTQCEPLSISKGALYYIPITMDPFSVAVGSQVNLDIITKAKQATKVPIVIHGGSGVDDYTLERIFELGVYKFNISSSLKR